MAGINSIIAIAGYSCWRVWLIKDRSERFKSDEISLLTLSEVFYSAIMLYLLFISSKVFLILTLAALIIHVLMGFYVEIFKPEHKLKEQHNKMLTQFWFFVLVDTAITLGCFLLMINFGQ